MSEEYFAYAVVAFAVAVAAFSAYSLLAGPRTGPAGALELSAANQQYFDALNAGTEDDCGDLRDVANVQHLSHHPGQYAECLKRVEPSFLKAAAGKTLAELLPNGATASAATAAPKSGPVVSVDYLGFFENGTVFDTSVRSAAERNNLSLDRPFEPLNFTLGAGMMIPGFEAAVAGMSVGEKKTIRLSPEEAYGEWEQELLVNVSRKTLEEGNITVEAGAWVYTSQGAAGRITYFDSVNATIDFNSPLAGKTLYFNVTLVSKS